MKAGIVTFFQDHNAGTCLQAYALQETIKKLGYEVDIINYVHNDIESKNKDTLFFSHLAGLMKTYANKKIVYYNRFKESDQLTYNSFEKFKRINYQLNETEADSYDALLDLSHNYNAFVCGSDMIWAPNLNIDYRVYYLQFCEKEKRVAYAPSFGTGDLSEDYKKEISKYITNIPHLSCRESSGVEWIMREFGVNAQYVLDPTQLISKSEWKNKFNLKKSGKRKYILCYLFPSNYDSWYKNVIKKASRLFDADVRFVPMERNQHYLDIKFGIQGYGPEEFINLIYGADFVITNSYHGFMFSLIFEKPFCILRRKKDLFWAQYEDRFDSILEKLNYRKGMLEYGDYVTEDLKNIDYDQINISLNRMRDSSIDYLKRALADTCKQGY